MSQEDLTKLCNALVWNDYGNGKDIPICVRDPDTIIALLEKYGHTHNENCIGD